MLTLRFERNVIAFIHVSWLDPDKIPAEWIPLVLEQLVALKRAVPIDQYTDAAIAAPKRAMARARAEHYAAKKAEQEKALEAEATPVELPDLDPEAAS